MTIKKEPRFRWQHEWNIDLVLMFLLGLTALVITYIYVSHEHQFYFWDASAYHDRLLEQIDITKSSMIKGLQNLQTSMGYDYTYIYTIPLIPFLILSGNPESRLLFITGLVLFYLLPLAMVMGAIATRLIPAPPRHVFWMVSFLSLFVPWLWVPTLGGLPDAGAALFMGLAVYIYLRDINLAQRWQVVTIGFLLALTMLFRRHFAYNVIAFFGAMIIQTLIIYIVQGRYQLQIIPHLKVIALRIGLILVTSFITLLVLGLPFLENVLTHNYNQLYVAYVQRDTVVFRVYVQYFGQLACIMTILGLFLGISYRLINIQAALFVTLLGIISLGQWVLWVRQIGPHYTLHFSFLLILGVATFIWVSIKKTTGLVRVVTLATLFIYLTINFVVSLSSVKLPYHQLISPLFSVQNPPAINKNYDQIVDLVNYLHTTAQDAPLYVVDSSAQMNEHLLRNAARELFGADHGFRILWAPQVDSRDRYPIENLLYADYVVMTTPFQHHLALKEQDVVHFSFEAFAQNQEIAQDFVKMPRQFVLNKGEIINIYHRIKPTSFETAIRTMHTMQQYIGERPGSQLDWVNFSNQYGVLLQEGDSYSLQMQPRANPPPGMLYVNPILNKAIVTGHVTFTASACQQTLSLLLVDMQGSVLNTINVTDNLNNEANFMINLATDKAAYLVFTIYQSEPHTAPFCPVIINQVHVLTE